MPRVILHDHHDFDNGGPIRGVPGHDHTSPVSGGELPPPADTPPPTGECCPPDPPFLIPDCGDMDYVQSTEESVGGDTTKTLTLGATPTEGNLLVAMKLTSNAVSADNTVWPDGFVVDPTDYGDSSVDGRLASIRIATRPVGPGDGTTYEWTTQPDPVHDILGNGGIILAEYSGLGAPTFGNSGTTQPGGGVGLKALPAISPAPGPALILWFFCATPDNDLILSTPAGVTERLHGYGGDRQDWHLLDQIVADASGSYNGDVNAGGDFVIIAGISFTPACATVIPKKGQTIAPEQITFDGLTDSFRSNYDYRAASPRFFLSGERVILTETDTITGELALPAGLLPGAGEIGVLEYETGFGMATGAGNPQATPTDAIIRPGDIVMPLVFGNPGVAGDGIDFAHANHVHEMPEDPALSVPLAWDLLTTGEPDPELIFSGGNVTWVEVTP